MLSLVIVDDEEWLRKLLKKLIPWKELGLSLAGESATGAHAAELCRLHHPGIVVTDIRMPGMDGLALMQELAEASPSCKVIVISGHGEFEYARKALRHGALAYLLKPIDEDELKEALMLAINRLDQEDKARRTRRTTSAEIRRLRSAVINLGQLKDSTTPQVASSLSGRAEAIIRADLSVQRTLESVAEELGVTASYLSAAFKRETSVGFAEYSTLLRMEKARDLMSLPSAGVIDVATLLGYADPHYFSRVFKRHIGVSPVAFRGRSDQS